MEGLCAGDDAGSDLNPKDRSLVAPVTGQVVPKDVPVYSRSGVRARLIDGHRVWVERNSNRILKVFN